MEQAILATPSSEENQLRSILDLRKTGAGWGTGSQIRSKAKKGTGFLVTHVERKTGHLVMEHLVDKQSATLNAGSVKAFQNIPGPLNDITNCQ